MTIQITEKIKRQRGVTRYCNCDNCSLHGNGPCPTNATVVALVDGQSIQLCGDCLAAVPKGGRL